jgi:alpha-ketoglutarate-dependent taurine dioxygenase
MSAASPEMPDLARAAGLETEVWQHDATRVLAVTATGTPPLDAQEDLIRQLVARCLHDHGAVLFRGFAPCGAAGFRNFAASFGHELLSYDFASTPRRRIADEVYSSTEYPNDQWIPQHNEQAYMLRWPMKIWFYCDDAPRQGGETPISNSRALWSRLDPAIRKRFVDRGLMYVRNYGGGLDLPWEQVFQTSERAVVEDFCRAERIICEWSADGNLRTRQICPALARHPVTGDIVWFNQAHLFHVSGLPEELREVLLAVVEEADLPRNVYYGDGSTIEAGALDEIRGVYAELMLRFTWQNGDLLMLDNMLTAHGRAPFDGPRRILVAMAEAHAEPNLHFD